MNWRSNPILAEFGVLDVVLAVLLGIGCALSLPIYWTVFGMPFVRLWKRCRARRTRLRD